MNIIRNIKKNKIIIILLFIILLVLIYHFKRVNNEYLEETTNTEGDEKPKKPKTISTKRTGISTGAKVGIGVGLAAGLMAAGPAGLAAAAIVAAALALDEAVKDAKRINTYLTPPRCFPKVSFFLKVNDLIRENYFGTGFKYIYTPIKNIIIKTKVSDSYVTPIKSSKKIESTELKNMVSSGEASNTSDAKKKLIAKNLEEASAELYALTTNYIHTGALAKVNNTIAYIYSNLLEINSQKKLVKKENDALAGRPDNNFFDCFWSTISTERADDNKGRTMPLISTKDAGLSYTSNFNKSDDYNVFLPGCTSAIVVNGRKQDTEMKNLIRKTLHEIRNLIYETEKKTNIQRIVFLEYGYPVECREEPRSIVFMFILHTDGQWYGNFGGLHMRYENMYKSGNDIKDDVGNNKIILEMFLHKETYLKKINFVDRFPNDPMFRQVEFNPDGVTVKKILDNIVEFDHNNLVLIDTDINIYGVNSNKEVYKCKEPCNDGKWTKIPGTFSSITSDTDYLYGTTENNDIYVCPKPCTKNEWVQIDGNYKYISAGTDYLYGIDENDEIYKCKAPCIKQEWNKIDGSLIKISSGKNYIYGLDASDNILRCAQPCDSGEWEPLEGKLKDIAAGDNVVYGINSEDYIYKCAGDCDDSNWEDIDGKLKNISSGKNYIYGVNASDNIFNCKGACTTNVWNPLTGWLKNITGNT